MWAANLGNAIFEIRIKAFSYVYHLKTCEIEAAHELNLGRSTERTATKALRGPRGGTGGGLYMFESGLRISET